MVSTSNNATKNESRRAGIVCPYTIPATSSSNYLRSFSATEAEKPISKPPFAQNCSRTDVVFAYSARFANPVKTILSTFNLALVAVNA